MWYLEAKTAPYLVEMEKIQMELFTINEVARDYLKVSRTTVYRLIAEASLETVEVRGCRRVTKDSLSKYVEGLEI